MCIIYSNFRYDVRRDLVETSYCIVIYSKSKATLYRTWGFQEVKAHIFQDNRHMKVVKSALRTGRLYLPGNIPGTHFC